MSKRVRGLATPSVLKWAREFGGYSLDGLVKKLGQEGVTVTTLKEWERDGGTQQPTYAQLKTLADIYERPIALFFFPEPPPEKTTEAQMRSLPETATDRLTPKMRILIRKAVVRQMDLAEIYDERPPEEYRKFKSDTKELKSAIEARDSDVVASYVRNYIKVTIEEQQNWRGVEDALRRWREVVESKGIWVFKNAFKDDEYSYSGFSLADEKFPVIYINNTMSKGRQIFTLFHELGHLLLDLGGIDFREDVSDKFEDQYRGDEVFCNAFAAELLVPRETLLGPTTSTPETSEIKEWADKYKVSRIVILRRWLSMDLISKEYYEEKSEQLWEEYLNYLNELREKAKEDDKPQGSYYMTQMSYLGDKYLKLAFQQYNEGKINEYQLADYLSVKPWNLNKLRERIVERRGDR